MLRATWTIGLLALLSASGAASTQVIELSASDNLLSQNVFHQLTVRTHAMSGDIDYVAEDSSVEYSSPFEFTFSGIQIPSGALIMNAYVLFTYSLSYGDASIKGSAVQEQCGNGPCAFSTDSFHGVGTWSFMNIGGAWANPGEGLMLDLVAEGYESLLRSGAPLTFQGLVAGGFSSGDWLPNGFNSHSVYTLDGLASGAVQAQLYIETHNPEPATFLLAGAALASIAWLARKSAHNGAQRQR